MMKRVAWTTAVLLLLSGCAADHGGSVYTAHVNRPIANLVLSRNPDHNWLAEEFTYRSSWPSVENGYRFDDAINYTQIIFDDQSYYDDSGGGGYTRESFSMRSGLIVR